MSDAPVWYIGTRGQQRGPLSSRQIADQVRAGQLDQTAYVYGPQLAAWTPISGVPEYAGLFHTAPRPTAPPPAEPARPAADQIDFEIGGDDLQYVEITLDPGEACIAEAGSFFYMDAGVEMQTVFGDGSAPAAPGVMGKLVAAGKRVLTGESLFMTVFGNRDRVRRRVAFAAGHPGRIVPIDLREHRGALLCQKDAFLCAAKGIAVGIALQKKISVGLLGGEGFILQKLEGDGLAFLHAGGAVVARQLEPGEVLRLDTGCLVALEGTVTHDVAWVGGIKSALFGGEGLFLTTLTGPGRVWIQSLPFGRLARRVVAVGAGSRGEEGSALGGLGLGASR